jgi:oligopeptide transport system substrate-binding protein
LSASDWFWTNCPAAPPGGWFLGSKALNYAVPILLAAGMAILTAGCVRSNPRADLVIINGAEPESLDPAIVTGQPDLRVVSAMFEGLTRNDPVTAAPVPGLAERWDISSDGCTYVFHLRTNALWSTGEPITAADFTYSWLRILNPATAADYAGQLFYVKNASAYNSGQLKDAAQVGVRALDARTFQVELERPTAFFLDLCAFQTLAVVPRQTIEHFGDRWLMADPLPVSGAYLLEEWRINDKVRLRKNPRYWDAANTKLDTIDILPIGSPITALNLYETGAADVVWDKGLVPTELLDVLINRPDFHRFDYLATYFLRLNTTRPPFNDPRVRRALALAIDKDRIVHKITRAGEKTASHLTPPGIANYTPPEGLTYNPAAARRLLAESGFPDGNGFRAFRYLFNAVAGGSSRLHEKIAIEIQQMWKEELGLQIELRQVEWKVFLASQSALDYDVCWSSWIGDYTDPNTFLDLFMSQNGNNRTGWKNNGYDQLMLAANREVDRTQRASLLRDAEKILVAQELPIIPLYFYVGLSYYDGQRISGIYPNLIDQHPLNAINVHH